MHQLLAALRAAGESTRLRILAALRNGELTVSELTRVLDQSQPRVSRHLKLLCDSGLLERYQEGAWVFHRITDKEGISKIARHLVSMIDINDPALERDRKKLEEIRQEKTRVAEAYFSQHADEWDSIRARMVSDTDIENRLINLVRTSKIKVLLDLGTGTGRILEILAPYISKGIGFDLSKEMLGVARSKLENAGVIHCTVRHSDIHDINMSDGCADAITIHQVLHYCDHPEQVIKEASRLLKPGGQLLLVDFLPHDLEFLREMHAHQRLGFASSTIEHWCKRYGLNTVKHEVLEAKADSRNPDTLTVGLWNASKSH